jgi:hypothetical protein
MSDIEVKRQFVMGLYPGPGWKARVKKMPDAQIVAIWFREHNKPKKADTPKGDANDPPPPF